VDEPELEYRFPFTSHALCRLAPPAEATDGRPPLLVVVHGYAQDGERQQRWMHRAVPEHFAAAYPDGIHRFEVRRSGRPPRIGHAWYFFSADRPAFLASLEESEDALWSMVDGMAERLGADPARVWLAGFSQGAYLVNVAALRRPERVAGWISQCGNLREDYLRGAQPALDGKPVLLQYGEHDENLPEGAAEACRDLIASYGADVSLSMHDAPHAITPSMTREACEWLAAHDPAVASNG